MTVTLNNAALGLKPDQTGSDTWTASTITSPDGSPVSFPAGIKVGNAASLILVNNVGAPGNQGFGVGICPSLPAGYNKLYGTDDRASENYGNYQYSDGSIICWIPAFYFRLGHPLNDTYSTYGVNSISVLPLSSFATEAIANSAGYYLHRAFVNAGVNQPGFFRDKYDSSNNAGTCSSIANASPIVSGPSTGQIGFSALTGAPANSYYGAIAAAKTRGSKFVPETVFMSDALARLTEAHAQAATGATYCAWFDSARVINFPKGNNNNALKDTNDATVSFTSAGASSYPNFALTGSGAPFAKTTHNGQACGITDVAGNIYKINLGMTSIVTTKTIVSATQANPVALTVTGHGYTTGQVKQITGALGMTQIADRFFTITVVSADVITLDGVDGTAFGAYTSGGIVRTGAFYTLKPSVDVAAITSGTTLATDHWGAAGVAAMFDAVTLNFTTAYPNNGNSQRFGNGANAVFDMSTSNGRALAVLGMPAAGGVSTSGTNAMGADEIYQYLQDQLCVISRGAWYGGSSAGVRYRSLSYARSTANSTVGLACASYLT